MINVALNSIVQERKSIIREFALNAKREGFKVIGVFEENRVDLSEANGKTYHNLDLVRFMSEDEALEYHRGKPQYQTCGILPLDDAEVAKILEDSLTTKDILQQYSYEKKRIVMLEFDKKCIEDQDIIKVTNYNPGSGGIGLEDKYSNRIERIREIEMALLFLKASVGRVEKALELIRDTNDIGCDALLLKHVNNESYDYIALALNCSRRTVIYKIKAAEELFEKILK